jgi:hypothetical protein
MEVLSGSAYEVLLDACIRELNDRALGSTVPATILNGTYFRAVAFVYVVVSYCRKLKRFLLKDQCDACVKSVFASVQRCRLVQRVLKHLVDHRDSLAGAVYYGVFDMLLGCGDCKILLAEAMELVGTIVGIIRSRIYHRRHYVSVLNYVHEVYRLFEYQPPFSDSEMDESDSDESS